MPVRIDDVESLTQALRCPACRGNLSPSPAALRCSCGANYPVEDGVVRFIEHDAFYEGAYQARIETKPTGALRDELGFYVVNTHYLWWVRKHVPRGSRMLELGCGGGVAYFEQHARPTGLDLSLASLRHLGPGYELALQADALAMPFAESSYDAAVSAYFYEHLDPASKERLLTELQRVLRRGSRIVFLFDVLSENPLFRWLRRDEAKFMEAFVEHDHHYGLETATSNLARFERRGFRVVDYHLANKTPLQHSPVYRWAESYGHPLTTALSRMAEFVGRKRALNLGWVSAVTLMDDLVEPLLPKDWARLMLVVLEVS